MINISVKGFKLSDGTVEKYDYSSLEDIVTDTTLALSGVAADAKKVGDEISGIKEDLSQLEGGGLTADLKAALDQLAQKVAYIDDDGQDYYDALHNALYPPANLSYITCVYTQSGTVYNTDTLDSLKSDLVVTAHYSNGSTQTVTAYTLSGSLTVGTSTITVSYSGKTTTFTVTVSEHTYGYIITSESDNVSVGSFDLSKAPTYKGSTMASRISCLGEDLLGYECIYGYTYHFEVTGATYSTMQISLSCYNETAKAAVQAGVNGDDTNDVAGREWRNTTSSFDYTPPQSINNSPPAFLWLAIRRNTSNTHFTALSEMGTITITRTAVTS